MTIPGTTEMVKTNNQKMEEHSKYERARIIGTRALQISMGAPFLVKLSDEEIRKLGYNTIEIAKLEYGQGLIPISIKRHIRQLGIKTYPAKPFDQTKLE